MLLVALAIAVLLVGPRRLLVSRWVLAATALAIVIGSPNLIYQATHDWPQLKMGRALARNNQPFGSSRQLSRCWSSSSF